MLHYGYDYMRLCGKTDYYFFILLFCSIVFHNNLYPVNIDLFCLAVDLKASRFYFTTHTVNFSLPCRSQSHPKGCVNYPMKGFNDSRRMYDEQR